MHTGLQIPASVGYIVVQTRHPHNIIQIPASCQSYGLGVTTCAKQAQPALQVSVLGSSRQEKERKGKGKNYIGSRTDIDIEAGSLVTCSTTKVVAKQVQDRNERRLQSGARSNYSNPISTNELAVNNGKGTEHQVLACPSKDTKQRKAHGAVFVLSLAFGDVQQAQAFLCVFAAGQCRAPYKDVLKGFEVVGSLILA
eukprot:1158942-Pelagomonas_calceolata.AAC.1